MGYYAVFLGLQYKHRLAMTAKFDAGMYDEAQTITLEIPMAVPYLADDEEFKRVDGSFEYEGEHYRLIKQKYSKDALIVVLAKDSENKRISELMSNYVLSFTDTSDEQDSHLTITFIKDYIPETFSVLTTSLGWQSEVVENYSSPNLESTFTVSVIHPPERA